MFSDLARMGKYLGQAARLMVGVPDYDTYVQPARLPVSPAGFFGSVI